MKKSLYKKLVRLARDGDPEAVEAVAEIVESLTENIQEALPVVPEGTAAVPVAGTPVVGMPAVPATAMVATAPGTSAAPVAVAPVAAYASVPAAAVTPAQAAAVPNAIYGPMPASSAAPAPVAAPAIPVAVVPAEAPTTDPDQTETALDCDLAAEIISRLDQLIALLTAAALAADEDPEDPDDPNRNCDDDPIEEIVEAVEEAVEAAVAAENPAQDDDDPDEPILSEAGEEGMLAEEVAEVIQEILEPSEVLEAEEENADCGPNRTTDAAVRAAMKVIQPALKGMSRKRRTKICADIAAGLRKRAKDARRSNHPFTYAAVRKASDRKTSDPSELGKRIMARRNANYKQ